MPRPEPLIVIGVPGLWRDRTEIVTSIVEKSGGYLFAGQILMHMETSTHFEMEVYESDSTLPSKMRSEGMGQIPEADLAALEGHTFTLYLTVDETGPEVVKRLMQAVLGLLKAGGIAVKLDSAGFSVSRTRWLQLTDHPLPYNLCRAMVTLVGSNDMSYTCGMRAFGLPDCAVYEADLDTAFHLAFEFCAYLVGEEPKLVSGHTFSLERDSPRYRLEHGAYPYPPGEYRSNPHGIWHLRPIQPV